jgi:hypothetical protein
MVQIYNPNVVGKHILIDIKNVNSDKLKLVEDMKLFLDKIVEELRKKSTPKKEVDVAYQRKVYATGRHLV